MKFLKHIFLPLLLAAVFGVQLGCSSEFEVIKHDSGAATPDPAAPPSSSDVDETPPEEGSPVAMPPALPPIVPPELTPIAELPPAPELSEFLPKISDSQCQPKIAISDPFIGIRMNTKTVCPNGCTYSSLSEAVTKAQPNDEIAIAPGTYTECLTLKASPVILRGMNGLVTLDGRACRTALTLNSREG